MSGRVTLVGGERLTAKLGKIKASARPEVATALNEVGQEIFAESQRRVPIDTGNLASSARIEAATAETLKAEVSYGGTAAGYALVVHEAHATGSKYLEAPARNAAARLQEHVKAAVKRAVDSA